MWAVVSEIIFRVVEGATWRGALLSGAAMAALVIIATLVFG